MDSLNKKSLKVLQLTDWASFIEDVNYNFSVLLSSPLYQGVQGDQGEQGKSGVAGTRGAKWLFATYQKINDTFSDITVPSNINEVYLSQKMSNAKTRQQLYKALTSDDNGTFVDGDVIVANGFIYSVNLINNRVEYTNETISGTDTSTTSITEVISSAIDEKLRKLNYDELVQSYIPKTVRYKNNADSSGSSIIGEIGDFSSIDIYDTSYAPGLESPDVIHKYLVSPQTIISNTDFVTHLIGPYDLYHELIQQTLSYNSQHLQNNTNSSFGPCVSSRPALIVLQNDTNSGILIGYRNAKNFTEFGELFINEDKQLVITGPSKSSTKKSKIIIGEDSILLEGKNVHINSEEQPIITWQEDRNDDNSADKDIEVLSNEPEDVNIEQQISMLKIEDLENKINGVQLESSSTQKTLENISKRLSVVELSTSNKTKAVSTSASTIQLNEIQQQTVEQNKDESIDELRTSVDRKLKELEQSIQEHPQTIEKETVIKEQFIPCLVPGMIIDFYVKATNYHDIVTRLFDISTNRGISKAAYDNVLGAPVIADLSKFALCDGNNGFPDLCGSITMGAENANKPGSSINVELGERIQTINIVFCLKLMYIG